MNEQTTQLINDILQKGIKAAEVTGNFAIEQTPEVIQQLLAWKFTLSLMSFLLGVAIFIAAPIITHKVWHKSRRYYKEQNSYEDLTPLSLLILVVGMVGIIFIDLTWLKIWIAPKLFLLEYAASLVK